MTKLDLNSQYIPVGPYTIQEINFYGLPTEADQDEGKGYARYWRGRLKFIAEALGLVYDEARSGVQTGYGHGYETLTLVNTDGSLVFQVRHVNHCDGPGYSCSYSHGPWYKYGEYHGSMQPDAELREAIRVKELLQEIFNF